MDTGTISTERYLQQYRQAFGEESWRSEVKRLILEAIKTSPKHEVFWKELTKDYTWLDWDSLKQEAQGSIKTTMAELLKEQMPGIKSQAQYNAVLGALDAVRLVLNAILEEDKAKETEARKALEMAFDVTAKATEITNKLEAVPEAATSKKSEDFKNPPVQFHEYDIQRKLLTELEHISTLADLNKWYVNTKEQRDRVITQNLRDILMDTVRAKKGMLEKLFSK
jgi:hypothetical protein